MLLLLMCAAVATCCPHRNTVVNYIMYLVENVDFFHVAIVVVDHLFSSTFAFLLFLLLLLGIDDAYVNT